MTITVFHLPPLVTGISIFTLGLFVLRKNKRSAVHSSFFVLCLCASIWQLSSMLSWAALSEAVCVLWGKALYLGVAFISAAFYHFSVEFNKFSRQKIWVQRAYLLSAGLFLFILRRDFITGAYETAWGRHIIVGPSHDLFLLLWFIPLIFVLRNFYRGYKSSADPFERRRRHFVFVTYTAVYLALIDYLPSYRVPVPYPFGFAPLLFFIGSTAYAILKYRILGIHVVLKRVTMITAGASAAAAVIYIAAFYAQSLLLRHFENAGIILPVFAAFAVGLSLVPLIRAIRALEQKEFSRQFAYRGLLRKKAERFSRVKSIRELLTFSARDISTGLGLDYIGIFLWDNAERRFILQRSQARSPEGKKIRPGLPLAPDTPLAMELAVRKTPLIRAELTYLRESGKTAAEEKQRLTNVIEQMNLCGADIIIPCLCEDRLLALLTLRKNAPNNGALTREDIELLSSLSGNLARTVHGFLLKEEKIRIVVASQHALISAIEAKDKYTRGHTDRVAYYAVLIGRQLRELRSSPEGLSGLRWAAQLHDIGKISIPDHILGKKTPLTTEEWRTIRGHPENGIRIVYPVREWLGNEICAGILYHHENYDGSGYPHQKKGDEIPLFARIIRVADAFDAMAGSRPYRRALSQKKIAEELRKFRGVHFHPGIADIMLEIFTRTHIAHFPSMEPVTA